MLKDKLLIIEDEQIQIDALKDRFRRRHLKSYAALDFAEALTILNEKKDI